MKKGQGHLKVGDFSGCIQCFRFPSVIVDCFGWVTGRASGHKKAFAAYPNKFSAGTLEQPHHNRFMALFPGPPG